MQAQVQGSNVVDLQTGAPVSQLPQVKSGGVVDFVKAMPGAAVEYMSENPLKSAAAGIVVGGMLGQTEIGQKAFGGAWKSVGFVWSWTGGALIGKLTAKKDAKK